MGINGNRRSRPLASAVYPQVPRKAFGSTRQNGADVRPGWFLGRHGGSVNHLRERLHRVGRWALRQIWDKGFSTMAHDRPYSPRCGTSLSAEVAQGTRMWSLRRFLSVSVSPGVPGHLPGPPGRRPPGRCRQCRALLNPDRCTCWPNSTRFWDGSRARSATTWQQPGRQVLGGSHRIVRRKRGRDLGAPLTNRCHICAPGRRRQRKKAFYVTAVSS